eukprot:4926610-Pyramimonas_sp.AAC.1
MRVRRRRAGGSGQESSASIPHPVQWRHECLCSACPHFLQQAQGRWRRLAQHDGQRHPRSAHASLPRSRSQRQDSEAG